MFHSKSAKNLDNHFDDYFYYIIDKGVLGLTIDKQYYTLLKDNSISTKALENATKTKSILKTVKKTHIYKLPLKDYTNIVNKFIDDLNEKKYNFLKQSFLFLEEDKKVINIISNRLIKKNFKTQTILIKENDFVNKIYFIETGQVICKKNDKTFSTLDKNLYFGLFSFVFFGMKATYSYYADPGTTLYTIDYDILNNILLFNSNGSNMPVSCHNLNQMNFSFPSKENGLLNNSNIINNSNLSNNAHNHKESHNKRLIKNLFLYAVNNCQIFSKYFNRENFKEFYDLFALKYYYDGDVITNGKNKKIILPIEGFFNLKSDNNILNYINFNNNSPKNTFNLFTPDGNFYFENLLTKNNEIESKSSSIVLESSWSKILKIIPFQLNKNYNLSDIIKVLKKVKFFDSLSDIKLFYISENIKLIHFKEKELILKNGPISDRLFIIKQGKVSMIINQVVINELSNLSYFGDIINKKDDNKQKPSYYAKSSYVECYYLDKEVYDEIIQIDNIQKTKKNYLISSIKLNNLYYLKELGEGAYGKVYLVHNRQNFYAMKTAKIDETMIKKKMIMSYLGEKNIMAIIHHPFIANLINTYKTNEYIIFLIEYIKGKTLRHFLDNDKNIYGRIQNRNVEIIQFIGGSLCIVINYLQKRRIIHRDLKPDNIMINEKGYIKVIDFGVAKNLSGKDHTYTVIGTPKYMSPEQVRGHKYSFSADIWSCGVILYEVFFGKIPFGFGSKDTSEIYNDIIEKNPIFPSDFLIEDVNNFIKDLLNKDPIMRTNCFYKWKNYKLFSEYNLNALINQEIDSPIMSILSINNGTNDSFNNDINIDEEVMLGKGQPVLHILQDNLCLGDVNRNVSKNEEDSFMEYFNEF